MAQPTAQDLIDALDRLTKALAAVQQKQAAAPAGPGIPFVGNPNPNTQPGAGAAPTAPQNQPAPPKSAGPVGSRLGRLARAYRGFLRGQKALTTFRKVRGLARAGKWGQAFKVGRKGFGAAARGLGLAGRAGGAA